MVRHRLEHYETAYGLIEHQSQTASSAHLMLDESDLMSDLPRPQHISQVVIHLDHPDVY